MTNKRSAFCALFAEGLDVDGGQAEEALSTASMDFLAFGLLASESILGLLSTCAMQGSIDG